MLTLPAELLPLIVEFAPLFSKPVWEHATVLGSVARITGNLVQEASGHGRPARETAPGPAPAFPGAALRWCAPPVRWGQR